MAGAYTSLLSFTNTIDLIENHPSHCFLFDRSQIHSLQGELRFLLEFIQSSNSHGRRKGKDVEDLEARILWGTRLIEHTLESLAVDQILARAKDSCYKSSYDQSPSNEGSHNHSYSYDLQPRLDEYIYSIREKIQKHKEKCRVNDEQQQIGFMAASAAATTTSRSLVTGTTAASRSQVTGTTATTAAAAASRSPVTGTTAAATSRSPVTGTAAAAAIVVGFDNYSIQVLDFLTGHQKAREIISVVGMGGSGKTTLARTVFSHKLIFEHFDICAWATVSQKPNTKEILLELLSPTVKSTSYSVGELGEQLHKKLYGRRYLIVLDDMWGVEVWDRISHFFPDCGETSRILVTTRLLNVASYITSSTLKVDLLDEDKSWELFCANTFGEEGEGCPKELVDIGKAIVEKCKGLPLSIVVIARYLRKSLRSIDLWVHVARYMTSVLSSGDDECLSILSLSYHNLPPHLKPCFLYMGVFREDQEVLVSTLTRLWIAEGFLRPDGAKSLEKTAEDYLDDLVDRNLISIKKEGQNGQSSKCSIHDLLREMCLEVGREEKFFCALKHPSSGCLNTSCQVCYEAPSWIPQSRLRRIFPTADGLLSLNAYDPDSLEWMFSYFNMRYIYADLHWSRSSHPRQPRPATFFDIQRRRPFANLPSWITSLWNLQTLVIRGIYVTIVAPPEIWEMLQLRHIDVYESIRLPDPPRSSIRDDSVDMPNLHTLKTLENLNLGFEVCKRIPSVQELALYYTWKASSCSKYRLRNLDLFLKVKSLRLEFKESNRDGDGDFPREMRLPRSLKELFLGSSELRWEDLSMVGSLPNLEVLTLFHVRGNKWDTVEGEFLRLKSLSMNGCKDLVCWESDNTHFPVLETLTLRYAYKLAEFPSDVETLRHIHLDRCSVPAAISAMRMAVEQEELGNEDLRLEIEFKDEEEMESVKKMVKEQGIESNNVRLNYYSSE